MGIYVAFLYLFISRFCFLFFSILYLFVQLLSYHQTKKIIFRLISLLLFFTILFFSNSLLWAEAKTNTKPIKETDSLYLNLSYFFENSRTEQNFSAPKMSFFVEFSFYVNPNDSIQLSQGFVFKNYVQKDSSSWTFLDTTLQNNYILSHSFLNMKWSWIAGFSLPISEDSKMNQHITTIHTSFPMEFEDELFGFSLAPFLNYFVNEYKTITVERVSFPLNLYQLGGYFKPYLNLSKRWNISFKSEFSTIMKEQAFHDSIPSENYYSLSFSLTYSHNSNVIVSLSHVQADSWLNENQRELYVYDAEHSLLIFSLSLLN